MTHGLHIGLVYEGFGSYPRRADGPVDQHVEYEPEETVALLEASLRRLGHTPVRLGEPERLLESGTRARLSSLAAVVNIAEAYGSRNREAWGPVLLEMAGVPVLGSDALTLSLCLDKLWAKRHAGACGIPVTPSLSCDAANAGDAAAALEPARLPGPFPLFVKPRWEGSSKGIDERSRVEDAAALAAAVARIVRDYEQPALIEPFLPGAEYTVTVVGHAASARALPVLQRALERESGIGLHALEGVHGGADGIPPREGLAHALPGQLDAEAEAAISRLALDAFRAFECRDFARVDFRLDAGGEPFFLEINPLPTFAPDGSFGILAELAGQSVEALVAEILSEGLDRLGLAAADHDADADAGAGPS